MASTRKRGQNHRGGESGSSKTRKTSRADPDKLVELRFLFSSDDEEEGQGPAGAEGAGGEGRGSRAAPIREGRWRRSDRSKNLSRSNNTLTGVFTQRTVNLMEHLNRRLYWAWTRFCFPDSSDPILFTLWRCNGTESDVGTEALPPPDDEDYVPGGSGYTTMWFWQIFEDSIKAARKAMRDQDFPRAFSICLATTRSFREMDHWMHKTEDTAHGAWLLNKLIKMWAELLPMQDRQLCFGGKETRLVVSKAIRSLCKYFKEVSKDGEDYEDRPGVYTHSLVYNHKNVRLADYKKILQLEERASGGPCVYGVARLLEAAYNRAGNGLLFKVRWAPPYDSPRSDTWEPYRSLKSTAALGRFLKSPGWCRFSSTRDFEAFGRRFPTRIPPEAAKRGPGRPQGSSRMPERPHRDDGAAKRASGHQLAGGKVAEATGRGRGWGGRRPRSN